MGLIAGKRRKLFQGQIWGAAGFAFATGRYLTETLLAFNLVERNPSRRGTKSGHTCRWTSIVAN